MTEPGTPSSDNDSAKKSSSGGFSAISDQIAGFVRAGATAETTRRIAVVLSLIGRAEAAGVLKRLPEDQRRHILDTMSRLGTITPSDARQALAAFGSRAESINHELEAGPETAREILVRAFGADEGERRFYEILPEEKPRRFGFLENADGGQLAMLLREESAEVVTIIVSMMPEGAAARLIEALPEEMRLRVILRLSRIGEIDPSILEMVENTLKHRLESLGSEDSELLDGVQQLADILRHLDLSSGGRILEDLDQQDHELVKEITQRLSTFEDILRIPSRDLQRVLQRVDDVDLAVIIKGKRDDLVARILENVSERRAALISMQRETLGPMRRGDVDRVAADFLKLLRQMAATGEIVLPKPGEEYVGLEEPTRGRRASQEDE